MSSMTFFRNVRADGGIRLGIEVDGERVFHSFRPGPDPEAEDPALDWYLDIHCEGDNVPDEPEAAKRWYVDHAPLLQQALTEWAGRFDVGLDSHLLTVRQTVANAPPGMTVELICSALRTIRATGLGDRMREAAHALASDIRSLPREYEITAG